MLIYVRSFVRACVRPSGSSLSRAVNLHLSRSESSQKAIREHSYRVIQSEPKILRLVFQMVVCHLRVRSDHQVKSRLNLIKIDLSSNAEAQ